MADGIQFMSFQSVEQKNSAAKLDDKQTNDAQETFDMLMRLMFPEPEKKPILDNLDGQQASKEDEASDTGETADVSQDNANQPQALDSLAAAVLVNLFGFDPEKASEPVDGQPSEQSDTTIILPDDVAFNHPTGLKEPPVFQQNLSDKLNQANALQGSQDKAAELTNDQAIILKQTMQQQAESVSLDELSEEDAFRQLQFVQNTSDKQVKSEQLLSDLLANKIAASSSTEPGNQTIKQVEPTMNDTAALFNRSHNHFEQVVSNQAGVKSFSLPTSVHHPDWSNQFSQQIQWLSQQPIKSAIIRLNPREMGALEVNLKVDKEHAMIQMTTLHDSARDLIEQSIPKLREMLQQQGLQLNDVNVQTRQQYEQQQQAQQDRQMSDRPESGQLNSSQSDGQPETQATVITKGLVDYFA